MADHGYFEELIAANLDGELTPEEDAALRTHLESCPECRAFYEAMEAVVGVTAKHLPPPPADLTARVMEAVRTAAPKKKKALLPFPVRAAAMAAAAALVLWAGARVLPLRMGSSGNEKSGDSTMAMSMNGAAPQEPMIRVSDVPAPAGGVDFAAAEDAVELSEPEEAPAAVESGAVVTEGTVAGVPAYLLYAGEDTDSLPLLESEDADFWAMLLTIDKSTEIPRRKADYTLVCLATDSGPQGFRLWDEAGVIVVETPDGRAGYSMNTHRLTALLEEIP